VQFKILGNCQAGGVADSLELLSNGSAVKWLLVSNDPKVLFGELSEHLNDPGHTVLLHESVREIILVNDALVKFDRPENIYIPTIAFAAFHPDIQYGFANGAVVKSGLDSDWNSRIMLWAYSNGLSQGETANLFREEVFQALGYFDEWDKSAETLKKSFDSCGFDYGRWIRSVQRTGVFMYGINHPMQIGLSQLAVQIAEKVFPNSHVVIEDLHTFTTDYLSHIVWPVYPEIGDHLGVEGSYHWRVVRKHASLTEFIELCFDAWEKIGLRKKKVNFIPLLSIEDDRLLRRLAGK
jgi:hypothetical protein